MLLAKTLGRFGLFSGANLLFVHDFETPSPISWNYLTPKTLCKASFSYSQRNPYGIHQYSSRLLTTQSNSWTCVIFKRWPIDGWLNMDVFKDRIHWCFTNDVVSNVVIFCFFVVCGIHLYVLICFTYPQNRNAYFAQRHWKRAKVPPKKIAKQYSLIKVSLEIQSIHSHEMQNYNNMI